MEGDILLEPASSKKLQRTKSVEELYCRKFQPNIFDPSRCFSCLRLRHLHTNTPPQEDSDSQSVVSSYSDVTRDQLHYEESSLCILSTDCDLYICNEEGSTDSTQDPSDYPELSDSISQEEDYLPHKDRQFDSTMTRLDPPPHRPNPRAWMEEARGRDGFSSHTGFRGRRDHDSGYHSLGRAGGVRAIREKSPPPPHRHFELGRPLPSHHSPEPKASIPFRNPDLGLPSQRRSLDTHDEPQDNSVAPGYGQRSLSPTPFKQAESLSSSLPRSYDDSYSRGHSPPYSASHQQIGQINTTKPGYTYSRSSSPSQMPSPFKQAELSSSSHKRSLDFSKGSSQRSGTPTQNSHGRIRDLGSFQKNLKTISHTIDSYSQSDSFGALKRSLHKTSMNVTSAKGGPSSRGSSPCRRGYETPNQSLLRKTDTKTSTSGYAWGDYGSSPPRRGYESPLQSPLRKTDTKTNSYALSSRGSSPARRGYDTPTQSQFRKYETASSTSTRTRDSRSCSPSRRSSGPPGQCFLQKTDTKKFSSGCDSRSPSTSTKVYNTSSPSVLCRPETKSPSSGHSRDSRSPSPSRRGHVAPTSSLLRKTTSDGSSHIHERSSQSSPSTRGHECFDKKVIHSTPRSDSVSYKLNKTSQSSPSLGSWKNSTHSLNSPALSRSSSPSTRVTQDHHLDTRLIKVRTPSSNATNCRSRSSSRQRRLEPQSTSPENQQSSHQNQSLSPQIKRHSSSQSSLESESISGGSMLNKEEYALMADLPKVKTIFEREGPNNFGKTQRQTSGKEELYKPASHSQVKDVYREWHGLGDGGRGSGRENDQRQHEERDPGQLSRTQSTSSLHTQRSSSPTREELNPWKSQLRPRPGHSQAQVS
ncbi:cyclin-dependent kinase 12-like [Arapaima gigas]